MIILALTAMIMPVNSIYGIDISSNVHDLVQSTSTPRIEKIVLSSVADEQSAHGQLMINSYGTVYIRGLEYYTAYNTPGILFIDLILPNSYSQINSLTSVIKQEKATTYQFIDTICGNPYNFDWNYLQQLMGNEWQLQYWNGYVYLYRISSYQN